MRAGIRTRPRPFAVYLNCKVAILFAGGIVYHGLPPGPTVIPKGSLFLTALPSMIVPLMTLSQHFEPNLPVGTQAGAEVNSCVIGVCRHDAGYDNNTCRRTVIGVFS